MCCFVRIKTQAYCLGIVLVGVTEKRCVAVSINIREIGHQDNSSDEEKEVKTESHHRHHQWDRRGSEKGKKQAGSKVIVI